MVIWLLFLAIILWVNLPSIVQKCLTNKLINKDYHPSNGPLKMIEWFRLYPIKKVLLTFIWLFLAYQSIRGFGLVWIEKHQEFLWIEICFLCLTLLTAYAIWKYIKTPYHCVLTLKRVFSKEELEEALKYEKFQRLQFENHSLQRATRMFVSKNWFVINGNLYAKKYIKDLRYVFPGTRNNTIWITYYNNKRLTLPFSSIDLSGDNGEEMKRILNKIMRGDQSIVVNAK